MKEKRKVYRVQYVAKNHFWKCTATSASGSFDGWLSGTNETKATFVSRVAREIAQFVGLNQLVVHNKDGRIAFERTYGADPRRSKG